MSEILTDEEFAVMTRETFQKLPEYSCSLPTGTAIGKRWRRLKRWLEPLEPVPGQGQVVVTRESWVLGEYVECEEAGYVGIKWRKILLVSQEEVKHDC